MTQPRHPKDPLFVSRFDNIPPQLIPNLTAKEYIGVLKESRWNNDYKNEAYKEYLNAKSIDNITYADYKCSIPASLVLRHVLLDFLKEQGLNIDKITAIDSDGDYPAAYSSIEVAAGKKESRLVYGDYLVSNETQKYIIHLEDAYPDSFVFKIASKKDTVPNSNALSELMVKYGEEHNFLKGQKIDPHCNFITFEKKYTWDDLILPSKIKDDIRTNLMNLINSQEVYRSNGLQVKRGLILSGQPGTGKSMLAKVLCNQVDWTIVWVSPKHLEGGAKKIAQIVQLCKDLSPTIMLLEDIDLYGGDRASNHNPALLGEMMNQLDGVQENTDIITIATTNNKEVLEKALLDRPGRFDKVIDFPLPDAAERLQMIKVFSNGLIDETLPFLTEVAGKHSEKFTGAQVRELVNMAVICAIDEKAYDNNNKLLLTEGHFKSAVKAVKGKDFTKSAGFNPTGMSSPLDRSLEDICFDD